MHLTRIEERMLDGEEGEARALAMKVIVKVGEALGAERLVEISHAHASGISYNNIGEPGLRLLRRLAEAGGRVKTYATVNPIGMDADAWMDMHVPRSFAEKQLEVLEALKAMGFKLTLTCTPYYIRKPRLGEHLAWGESSAVAYANSLLGARSNREGGPLTIMAALTGRTYYAGLHLDENRKPSLIVEAEAPKNSLEASLLGGYLGKTLKEGEIPYVRGIKQETPEYWLKEMCAAAGALGSLALCLIEGVSPEAGSPPSSEEKLSVDRVELERLKEEISSSDQPDLYFLGCPHASLSELIMLDRLVKGRVRVEFWVTLSRHEYDQASLKGIIRSLESKGIRVWRDTCPIVAPFKSLGYRVMATNSVKAAFYMPRIHGVRVVLMSVEEMARHAVQDV